jgi:hypothetical protein
MVKSLRYQGCCAVESVHSREFPLHYCFYASETDITVIIDISTGPQRYVIE